MASCQKILVEHPNASLVLENFNECEDMEIMKYGWAFSALVSFFVGFPASLAILWEMFKTQRRTTTVTPNHFFITNLSIMDGLFLAYMPLGMINHFFWENCALEKTWSLFYALSTCGRPLLMACTCLDCYLAVVHPIIYHKTKSLLPRVVMVGFVWTLTLASGIAYVFSQTLFLSMFPAGAFLIAIVIILVCDCCILHTLLKSKTRRRNIHPQKQRAIQTLMHSLVATVVSYLPPTFLIILGKYLTTSYQISSCIVFYPVTITSTLGSAIMPMLFLYSAGRLNYIHNLCQLKNNTNNSNENDNGPK